MTTTLTSRGDSHETTAGCCLPAVRAFTVRSQRAWDGFFWAAKLVLVWLIMLGLPAVYERRLAGRSWSAGERLALQQLAARARAPATGGAAMHPFDDSEIQVSKSFVKWCILEWRVCATLSVVVLGLENSLPCCSVLNLVMLVVLRPPCSRS
jgi:hypothetical protein